jgi:hypothetical protein
MGVGARANLMHMFEVYPAVANDKTISCYLGRSCKSISCLVNS